MIMLAAHVLLGAAEPAPSPSPFTLLEITGNSTTMKAPCGAPGLRSCQEVLPGISTAVKKMVDVHLEAIYQGKVVNSQPTSPSDIYLPQKLIELPICNLSEHVHTSGTDGESSQNHLGQSCGTLCTFTCKTNPKTQGVECGTDSATCQTERAWTRGAVAQMIWHNYDAVLAEINGTQALKLSPRCVAAAGDPVLGTLFKQLGDAINLYLKVNAGRPIDCIPVAAASPAPKGTPSSSPSDLPDAPPSSVTESNPNHEAACYLSAARAQLESVLAKIATCEIFVRTDAEVLTDSPGYDGIPTASATAAIESCPVSQNASADAVQSCLNTNYSQQLKQAFLKQINGIKDAPKR